MSTHQTTLTEARSATATATGLRTCAGRTRVDGVAATSHEDHVTFKFIFYTDSDGDFREPRGLNIFSSIYTTKERRQLTTSDVVGP